MGSFNSLCAISGLPITYGTPVRFLLLTQSPFLDDWVKCYQHSLWSPRTFPIKALYNDYGSVEKVEEGPTRDVWMEALGLDLVEVGVGDNTFHDLAVRKDMDFDDFLEALQKECVKVGRRTAPIQEEALRKALDKAFALLKKEPEVATESREEVPRGEPGFPTLQSVEALIKAAGLPLSTKDNAAGYQVDEQAWGSVRIRWNKFGGDYGKDAEKLEALPPLLGDYAYMICAGSGSYAGEAEVIVRPKPGGNKSVHFRDPEEPLLVMQAMVREDVWQALLKQPLEGVFDFATKEYKTHTLSHFKKGLRDYLKHREEKLGGAHSVQDLFLDGVQREFADQRFPGAWVVNGRETYGMTIGPSDHWNLMQRKGPLPEDFIDTVAEYAYVCSALAGLGYWWRPSYAIGGQDPTWPSKLTFLANLVKIVKAEIKEDKRRSED